MIVRQCRILWNAFPANLADCLLKMASLEQVDWSTRHNRASYLTSGDEPFHHLFRAVPGRVLCSSSLFYCICRFCLQQELQELQELRNRTRALSRELKQAKRDSVRLETEIQARRRSYMRNDMKNGLSGVTNCFQTTGAPAISTSQPFIGLLAPPPCKVTSGVDPILQRSQPSGHHGRPSCPFVSNPTNTNSACTITLSYISLGWVSILQDVPASLCPCAPA